MLGGSIGAGEFYSILSACFWASAVILFRLGGRSGTPFALNLFKDSIGLLLFLVTLLLVGIPFWPAAVPLSDWLILLASGAVGIGIADTLFFASLNRLGAVGSAIVDCLYSPFVVISAALYLHEPLGLGLLVAMGLMIAALLLGIEPPPAHAGEAPAAANGRAGVLLGATAMLLMAVAIVGAKPVLERVDPWWATAVRLTGGVLLLAVQGTFRQNRAAVRACFRPGPHWRVTLPSAVVGAYGAMITWILGMQLTHASIAGILNQLSTLLVIPLAAIFLHEPLRPRRVLAVLLGMLGGFIVVH